MVPENPQRTCVGCRRCRDVAALVRITGGDAAAVDGPSSGRGAWLCRAGPRIDERCLARALRTRAFSRAWRRSLDVGERDALRVRLETWRSDV